MKLSNFSFFQRYNQRRLVSIIILGVFLCIASEAFAKGKYKPRNRKPPITKTNVGASRGCPSDGGIPLTLLAPKTYVGETASERPIFAWYVSNSRPVKFALYEVEPSGKLTNIVPSQEKMASKGVNTFVLPREFSDLKYGKRYFWEIKIRCPNDSVSEGSEFEVVKIPVSTNVSTIDTLANSGLWYEAFSEVLKLHSTNKLGKEGASLIQDLAQLDNLQNDPSRIKSLQAIADEQL